MKTKRKKTYWNCLDNKLTYFKRIGHVKNMLKGNQCIAKCFAANSSIFGIRTHYMRD